MLRGSLSGNSRLPAVAEAAHLLAQARGLWHHPLPINRHELMPYGVSPYPSTGTSLRLVASMDDVLALHEYNQPICGLIEASAQKWPPTPPAQAPTS
eukprot:scaffold479_cov17-Tisochrysis_lutea.AAC.1